MDTIYIYSILTVILLAIIYWIRSYKFDHWEKYGIPTVPSFFPFGSQAKFFYSKIHEIELERYKKYGRLYGYYEGVNPVLSIADPELLKKIFVKDFQFFTTRRDFKTNDKFLNNFISTVNGAKWRKLRTLTTPAFTTGKIKKMTSIILSSTKTLTENFERVIESNEPLDVWRYFGAFAMDVIASTAFASKLDSHNDPSNKFVSSAKSIFGGATPWRMITTLFFPTVSRIIRLAAFPPKAISFFEDRILGIIKERQRTGQKREDFLQLLLDASEEHIVSLKKDDDGIPSEETVPSAKPSSIQKGLTQDEVVAQCLIFFLASYHATASTLAFACYELALNMDCQEKVIEEIDSTLSKNQDELTYDTVQGMKYIENVIYETLRMYPPLLRLDRVADEDYVLGDTGITLAKGTLIGVPSYAIHLDPEFYPEPTKFDPERFTAEAKAQRHQYTYLPFGQGPRNCLGMRFAMMEMKLCLAHVFRNFRLKRNARTKVPLEYGAARNFLQPKEIILSIERRTANEVQ